MGEHRLRRDPGDAGRPGAMRVDNRGVGGSRHAAWPAWSFSISIEEQTGDLAAQLAWLREQPNID